MSRLADQTDPKVPHPEPSVARPPEPVMPPAPPGESTPEAVARTRAVAEALTELGNDAQPQQVAEFARSRHGIDIDLAEVAALKAQLLERARTPPGPDQPPPQEARRRTEPY
jgi:hypothetical protein